MQKYLQASSDSQGLLMSFMGKIKQLECYSRDANIIFHIAELKKSETQLIRKQWNNYVLRQTTDLLFDKVSKQQGKRLYQ